MYVAGKFLFAFILTAFPSLSASAAHPVPSQAGQEAQPAITLERLPAHTPAQVLDGRAIRVGHYSPEQKLRLAVALRPPHMAEEEQFLAELQDIGSPNFRKFLTPEEWNARFGPSAEDEQKVVDWATSQGLTVTNRFSNRLVVDLEAPAGVIEKAFGLTLNNYRLDDEVDFANDRDPLIPASLSGIVSAVQGLNSMQRLHSSLPGGSAKKGPDYAPGPVHAFHHASQGDGDPARMKAHAAPEAHSTNGFLDPSDLFSSQAYDWDALMALGHCCNPHNNKTGSPPESSIAVAAFAGFADSDVQAFFKEFGLSWNYTVYTIDGTTGQPGVECTPGVSGCAVDGPNDEATLDTEWAIAMANNPSSAKLTAHVYVYEGANMLYVTFTDMYNYMLTDGHAKVFSTSWAGTETLTGNDYTLGETVWHPIFNAMAGQGWTLVASSGDGGATNGCGKTDALSYPESEPSFVSAGGTELSLNLGPYFNSEVAWTGGPTAADCAANYGGGGGGVSKIFGQPSWQKGLGYNARLVPDFSLNAGGMGQNVYFKGGLGGFGGTSIVAPELAGFFAQENAYLSSLGSICGISGTSPCSPIGNPNPFLYFEGMLKDAAHYPFYDIVAGCNSNYYTATYNLTAYCAHTGYDEATGWGSANMLQLAWALNWEIVPARGVPYVTFSGPPINKWYNTDQDVLWTIHDYVPKGGTPGTSIAGETAGWDSLPADPASEPTPGAGNSFYSGPLLPNSYNGCLGFERTGCLGGVSQGCHTAYVRGWNNQGWSTANLANYPETYGPLCYDTVAPTISVNTNPPAPASGWFNTAVTVTLTAADPGDRNASGIDKIYGVVGTTNCSPGNLRACQLYATPFRLGEGTQTVTTFSVDRAGNFSNVLVAPIKVDATPPATKMALGGTGSGGAYQSAVNVGLRGTDNLSGIKTTYYSLDGAATVPYSGVFTVSTVGSHTLKYWSVDVAGNTESANTGTFAISSPTASALTASPNPAVNGQAVTLTVTVAPTAGITSTPTGNVTFLLNGKTQLGTGVLTGGTTKLSTTALGVGNLALTVSYAGAANFQASTSPVFTEVVHGSTTTTLTASPNPAFLGQSVTLTATVKPSISGAPTGTVQFLDGATPLGTTAVNGGGVASLATSALAVGTHSITAVYSGDTTYAPSTSAALSQAISPAPTTTTLHSSPNPSAYGQSVLITATVDSSGGGPLGTVTFKFNGAVIGTGALNGGIANLSISSLPVGTDSITATYGGSAKFSPSTSSTLSQVVNSARRTATLEP